MKSKYTDSQVREAARLRAQVGEAEASRRTGIPQGSFWSLLRRLDQISTEPGVTVPQVPVAPPGGEERAAHPPSLPPPMRPPLAAEPTVDSATQRPASPKQPGAGKRGVARLYTPSQKAEAVELAATVGPTQAATKLGISRFSIYEWLRRKDRAASGAAPDPTVGPDPADIEARRDREILDVYAQHPGLGPTQISNQLRRKGIKVAVATTRHVMEDAGYRPKKVVRRPHNRTYEAVRPNHIWHMDFVHRYIGKASTFSIFLIDDHSRFVTGFGMDDAERADTVIESFLDATDRHGRPEMVVHDRGSAFWSWRGSSRFTDLLTEMGIDQIPVKNKEANGKSEAYNANLHKEFFDAQRFADVSEMRRALIVHLDFYNHRRTHQSLGGLLVPADRYFGRADQILARIEAGGILDAKDALGLPGRSFDLVRVTSSQGKPEIWLMGTKVLG